MADDRSGVVHLLPVVFPINQLESMAVSSMSGSRAGLLALVPALPVVVVESTSQTGNTFDISLDQVTTLNTGQIQLDISFGGRPAKPGALIPAFLGNGQGEATQGPL